MGVIQPGDSALLNVIATDVVKAGHSPSFILRDGALENLREGDLDQAVRTLSVNRQQASGSSRSIIKYAIDMIELEIMDRENYCDARR